MNHFLRIGIFLMLALGLAPAISAQTKKPKKPAEIKAVPLVAVVQDTSTVPAAAETGSKTNNRPAAPDAETPGKRNSRSSSTGAPPKTPTYFYEFTRPGFTYPRILIEHDEAGKGNISFTKGGSDELITDPVNLSGVTIAKLEEAFSALNFLESAENYQHERDYSHMGNTHITVRKNGRERAVKFNWTDNKQAKALMDEYRRIANEYTWRFELSIARENQQLETPRLMDAVDSYLKRGEISDPYSMIPFLTELTTDERLPLMARNHAATLLKQIEKAKK